MDISTLDHCNIEKCYVKLKKNETELEASNSHLSQPYSNVTEERNDDYGLLDTLGKLELISKDCYTEELQCSVCNTLEECKRQQGQSNPNNLGI